MARTKVPPDRRWIRREAARVLGGYSRPVQRVLPGPVRGSPNQLDPVTTEPEDREMVLRIECQCGRVGEFLARPAEIIGQRLRCSRCGAEPMPF